MEFIVPVLIALGVVFALAFFLGAVLAVLNKYFAVPGDETVKALRECLPGINCGACGYKGCDDYAAAIAEGKAKPNLCVPGAAGVANQLGAVLGIEVEPPKDVVAFVACNGNCEATGKKAKYDGIKTCYAANMIYAGPSACSFGCTGFGDCAAVCPSNAICIKDGIAHVDTSRCIGCGLCVDTCPKRIISLVPQDTMIANMCSSRDKGADARKLCKNACIGCGKCVKECPSGAIRLENNLAIIDYDKCVRCGKCAAVCPTGCLKQVFFPDIPEGFEY